MRARSRSRASWWLVASVALAGCGSSSSSSDGATGIDGPPGIADAHPGTPDAIVHVPDAPGDGSVATNASIALSGDRTGTFPALVLGGYDSAKGKSAILIDAAPVPAGYTEITIAIEVGGTLTAKDYPVADFTNSSVAIVAAGAAVYRASLGSGATGSFETLHLTSVQTTGQDGTTTVYEVHGSVQATLDSLVGGNPVTLDATF